MDNTSGSKTVSPLFSHDDTGSVKADQGAPVMASSSSSAGNEGKKPTEDTPRDFRFWAIIASLCVTGLLGALENTVVTTSLPTIVRALDLGDNYIWITNVFFLTRYATCFENSEFLGTRVTYIAKCCCPALLWPIGQHLWSPLADSEHRCPLRPWKRYLRWCH